MKRRVFKFETGACTHEGKVRTVNEDNYLVKDDKGVWVVSDGMGGHENGSLASRTTVEEVETIGNAATAPDLLARFNDRIMRANEKLLDYAAERGDIIIGATVVGVLVFEKRFACVWAGDSRVYHVRDGKIEQLSKDHTEAQELVDNGALTPEEAKVWPRRNVITRAVGVMDDLDLDLRQGDIKVGDTFVLCSDGLTGHVSDEEICEKVTTLSAQKACDALVELTLQRGATDNVTVIVVRCKVRDDVTIPGFNYQ